MPTRITNADRAAHGAAIRAMCDDDEAADAIADVLHSVASELGSNGVRVVLRRALMHFDAEREEEGQEVSGSSSSRP